jgi:membrane protein YqaA with SNARE-associated domain
VNSLRAVLQRRYGTAEWDAVLRASAVVAALAIYPTWRWPSVAGLVGFLGVTLFMSGPLSVVLPAGFEPMLMLTGRIYPPLLVALVGAVGNVYMDYINYHLFGAAINHPRLANARNSRFVRWLLALFQRSPFLAVWLCVWSPIPDWIPSTLAPLSRYSMRKYLFATFLGRFPRNWFFAALGLVVPVSCQVLVTSIACAIVIGIAAAVLRRASARPKGALPCGSSPLSSASVTQRTFESPSAQLSRCTSA